MGTDTKPRVLIRGGAGRLGRIVARRRRETDRWDLVATDVAQTGVVSCAAHVCSLTADSDFCLPTRARPMRFETVTVPGEPHRTNMCLAAPDAADAWIAASGRGAMMRARWRPPGRSLAHTL